VRGLWTLLIVHTSQFFAKVNVTKIAAAKSKKVHRTALHSKMTEPNRFFPLLFLLCHVVSIASSFASRIVQPPSPQTRHPTNIHLIDVDRIPEIMREALSEPQGKAALLNDIAEASTDILLFSSEPSTILLRLSAVIQRILGLTSDYLPNQSIRPDEILFNIPVVGASLFYLTKSAVPIIQAQFVELDELDLTAYKLCFAPVGVTLLQYKSMKATGCFDWVDVGPGRVLIDENEYYRRSGYGHILRRSSETNDDWKYLYSQYNGTVIKSYKENVFAVIDREDGMHIDDPKAQGLLGDTRFICNIEAEERARLKVENENDVGLTDDDQVRDQIATVSIGEKGAKMLRIDSYELFDLMEHDERLESSIRLLLLKSLRLKIGNLLCAYDRESNNNMDGVTYDKTRLSDEEENRTLSL
jgi:hypothetical protein